MKKYGDSVPIREIVAGMWGTKLAAEAFLRLEGEKDEHYFDELEKWLGLYETLWNNESKPSEFFRIRNFLESF